MAYLSPDLVQKALSISSSFAKGGTVATKPVARFRDGTDVDVDDDYGTFGAEELGASVEDTAASEDIGTRDDDEDIDFPDEFEVPDPDKYDYGPGRDDGGTVSNIDPNKPDYSKYTTAELRNARDVALRGREFAATLTPVEAGLIQAELDKRSGRPPDQPVSVTEAATQVQVDPVDFYTAEELADERADMAAESLMGASGAATDILGGYDRAMAEQRALANRDRMAADMAADMAASQAQAVDYGMGDPSRDFDRATGPAAPQVDADDMAGIGSVAPPSTVQEPPSGGIGDLGPVTPDELDEAEDIRGRQAALVEDLDTADDLGPFGEEEMLSGFRELQDKKAGLAGLGVLAGSPMLAAAPFARDIYKTLANPDVKAGELLAGKGLGRNQTAEEVVDEEGRRVGVVVSDPSGVVSVQPTSFKNAFDPALGDAYNKMNERESREREESGRGDDREPITEEDVAVEEEAGPKLPPTIDIIPFRPEDFYYFNPQRRYPYGVPSLMNMRTR